MHSAKIRPSCVGCRAPIADEKLSKALCKSCLGNESQHLRSALSSVNNLEEDFNRPLDAVPAVPRLAFTRTSCAPLAIVPSFTAARRFKKRSHRGHRAVETIRLASLAARAAVVAKTLEICSEIQPHVPSIHRLRTRRRAPRTSLARRASP